MDIKQHLRGNISSSEDTEEEAAAKACFAATDATDAAFRKTEPIPNPFFEVTGEKGPTSCWLWSDNMNTQFSRMEIIVHTIHISNQLIKNSGTFAKQLGVLNPKPQKVGEVGNE